MTVLVDNDSDPLSTPANSRCANELAVRLKRGTLPFVGDLCCGSLGYSLLLLITEQADELGHQRQHLVLFDTGPTRTLCVDNVRRLGVRLEHLTAVVLSHGHWDHTLGTVELLRRVHQHRSEVASSDLPLDRTPVSVLVHPKLFVTRGRRGHDGSVTPMSELPTVAEIADAGGCVVSSREPVLLCNDSVLVTGEIERVVAFESGLENHVQWDLGCQAWVDDPLVIDERGLVLNVRNHGLVVVTGCSHAGVINTIKEAQRETGIERVACVIGGLHLVGPNEARIADTLDAFDELKVEMIVPVWWASCQPLREESTSFFVLLTKRTTDQCMRRAIALAGEPRRRWCNAFISVYSHRPWDCRWCCRPRCNQS